MDHIMSAPSQKLAQLVVLGSSEQLTEGGGWVGVLSTGEQSTGGFSQAQVCILGEGVFAILLGIL